MNTQPQMSFTGAQIRHIMRTNGITIRRAAAVFNIPMKTVRERRANGVRGHLYCWEWAIYLPRQAAIPAPGTVVATFTGSFRGLSGLVVVSSDGRQFDAVQRDDDTGETVCSSLGFTYEAAAFKARWMVGA